MIPIDSLFLAYCIYVPLLAVLYLVEIWVILKQGSPFRSSFYSLFVATAVGDLIMIACTFHEFRMLFFPLVNGIFENYDCKICSKARVTVSCICPFAQDCLNCFVAFNRLTSILFPTSHDTIWKRLLPFAICFSYILPIAIFIFPGFRNITYAIVELPTYSVYFTVIDTSYLPWFNANLITITEIIVTSIAIVIMYSIAAISLRKFVGGKEMAKQERTLLKFGIINFVILTPMIFMQVLLGFPILPSEWMVVILYQFGWLLDLKFFGAAISMLVVNKSFRHHLLNSLNLQRPKNADKMVSVTENRMVHARH